MQRPIRFLLAAFAAALALLLVGAAYLAATFDPEDLKPALVERVQQDWQRTLAVPGRVRLSFFPQLGVEVGEVALSERGSAAPFASARSARVSLAVWPLLRRQVVVDRVQLDGLQLRLVRQADGRSNVDDLLGPAPADAPSPPQDGGAVAFDVAGVSVRDATLELDDRAAGRRVALRSLTLETGRLAPGVASALRGQGRLEVDRPALALGLELQGQLRLDPAQRRHGLDDLRLVLQGQAAGQDGVRLVLGGKLATDGAAERIALEPLTLEGAWPRAGGSALALQAQGAAVLASGALRAQLAGVLDGARFDARVGQPRAAGPLELDVEIDRLDVDQLAGRAPPAPGASSAAGAAGGAADAALPDLSALRALDARGQLRVGSLRVAGLSLAQLRLGVTAGGGRVRLEPIAAALYQGRLAGSGRLDVQGKLPQLTLSQSLTDVQLGPLLKDALARDSLEGRGDLRLDVSAQGGTVAALTRSLAGTARVELADGAVRGLNVAQALRTVRSRLTGGAGGGAGAEAGTGSRAEKTDFSALTASFRIDGGVARNDDLLLKSPLLRITGSGDVDLGARRLDYRVRATVVDTLQGQGGPELQALRGQTIPVVLSGPLDAVQWRIDVAGLAKEAVREKIEARKDEAKDKLREKLGDRLKGLFGK